MAVYVRGINVEVINIQIVCILIEKDLHAVDKETWKSMGNKDLISVDSIIL